MKKRIKICLLLWFITHGNGDNDIRFSQLRCPPNKIPKELGIHQLRSSSIFKPCRYQESCNCDMYEHSDFCYFDEYCFGCIHSSKKQYCSATTKCPTETWMCGNLVKVCNTYYTHKECGGDCVYRGTVCPERPDPCYYHGTSNEYPDWKCGEGDSRPQAKCKKHSEKSKFITCQGECLDISSDPDYECPQNKNELEDIRIKEKMPTLTYTAGAIIGVSVTALIIGLAITWCYITNRRDKKEKAKKTPSKEEDPGVFKIKDKAGNVLSEEYIRSCCGILLDRESGWGQFVAQLKRYHGTEIIERVEVNEEYGYAYGLCDYEAGEIVDYNVEYRAADDTDSDGNRDSVAEIVDFNARYGRASTSS